jgi:hypothetical protein
VRSKLIMGALYKTTPVPATASKLQLAGLNRLQAVPARASK